tara:strand:- start:91 stop:666 length:576 start_codon:yes stop_codon:yes gene_type:complete
MNKGISKNKVQRMRNIVTGDYTSKTNIRSGYTKKNITRVEGDVWEEKGKQWTIKRGIKCSVVKTNSIKTLNRVPLACPTCNRGMKHPAHKQIFKIWGMCVDCCMFWEQEMRKQGTYDDFMKDFNRKNFNAYVKDALSEYNDWLESRKSKTMVTEAGDIEDWDITDNNEELLEDFNKKVSEASDRFKEENDA